MGIPEGSPLEHRVEKLLADIDEGAAQYLLNGKSKKTMVALIGTVALMVLQGIGNIYYFMAKAPTAEWVDQRIDEKIMNAPITRGADMRISQAEFRIGANERSLSEIKNDTREIKNQVTEIKILLGQAVSRSSLSRQP